MNILKENKTKSKIKMISSIQEIHTPKLPHYFLKIAGKKGLIKYI